MARVAPAVASAAERVEWVVSRGSLSVHAAGHDTCISHRISKDAAASFSGCKWQSDRLGGRRYQGRGRQRTHPPSVGLLAPRPGGGAQIRQRRFMAAAAGLAGTKKSFLRHLALVERNVWNRVSGDDARNWPRGPRW